MTEEEESYVNDILTFFYHDHKPVSITDALAEFAARLLYEALERSKAMDLVPRPPGFKPGPLWLISQAVQVAWRSKAQQRIYLTVKVSITWKNRSEYILLRDADRN
jgi:hypothetical protein